MLKYKDFTNDEIELCYSKIAINIKTIRQSKNISQLDLAYSIGHKSVSTIAKIEANLENKHYNIEHLYKIATSLNVDMCEFFKDIKTTS
jgi:transcriptional regulator with XRE-family HTH domain